MPRIKLYIACSLDGFIAKEDGSIDWLTKYETILKLTTVIPSFIHQSAQFL